MKRSNSQISQQTTSPSIKNQDNDEHSKDYDCVICMELLRYPVALECGHTMCLECGQKLHHKMCPICRYHFTSNRLNKSLLLHKFMKKRFGQVYISKCKERKLIKEYYSSGRYEMLCDIMIDTMTEGKTPTEMFYTRKSLVEYLSQLDMGEFKFHIDECKLCIEKLITDNEILQVREYMLLADNEWILEKLVKIKHLLDSDVLLECLSLNVEENCDEHPELGEELTRRRRRNSPKHKETVDDIEQRIVQIIKQKNGFNISNKMK